MLSRFRRPEADLRVLLSNTVLHAGDELNARVELVPKSSFLVREGRVELICTETYVQKTSSQYGTHYQKKTQTRAKVAETFSDNGTLRSGAEYSTDVKLAVPVDAPRSISGTKVRSIQPGISWDVRASLDVASARDLHQSQEVTIVESPVVEDVSPRSVVSETGHRQCNLTLSVSSGEGAFRG